MVSAQDVLPWQNKKKRGGVGFIVFPYLATSMSKLDAHLGSLSVDHVRDAFDTRDMIIGPNARVLWTDPSSRLDR